MVEIVGHAKGAILAFNSLGNLATWRALVSTEAANGSLFNAEVNPTSAPKANC